MTKNFPDSFVPFTFSSDEGHLTTSEIIAMAWDDETSFDAIKHQTGLKEAEVIKIMRSNMKSSSFRMWRKRVSGRSSKHRRK